MAPLSRPFVLLAATCAFLVIALLAVWITLLPQRMTDKIAEDVARKTGLALTANGGSALTLQDGLAVRLNDVTVADPARPGVPVMTASRMRVKISAGRLFGSAVPADDVALDDPVFTFGGSGTADAPAAKADLAPPPAKDPERLLRATTVNIRNGTLRLRDGKGAQSLSVGDINGVVTRSPEGAVQADATALVNGQLTTLSGSIDDVRRLAGDGSPIDVAASAKNNIFALSGRARTTKGLELDGRLHAAGDELNSWLTWVGLPLSGFAGVGPVVLDSGFSATDGSAQLTGITLKAGAMTVTGKASLRNGGARPLVDASLTADVLDINSYRKGAAASAAPDATPSLTDGWSEQPFSFRDLTALDGKIDVTARTLVIGALRVKEAVLEATLDKGVMTAKLRSPLVAGGQASSNLRFAITNGQPDVLVVVDAEGVNAKDFLGPLTGFQALDGPVDLHAELTGQGDSEARLVGSLAGEVDLTLRDARLDGIALANTLSRDGAGWMAGDATVLTEGQVSATVADGIASLTTADLRGAGFTLRAEGEVDLLRQAVDLRVKPRVNTGGGTSLRLPVTVMVQGPWANPAVDSKATIKPKALIRELGDAVGSPDADAAAKAIGKKAKKTLKKLFGN